MPARDRSHYDRSYTLRARAIRRAAYADPETRCWSCGMTLAQRQAMFPAKRIRWQAGHTVDGDNSAPLLAEHSDCNQSRGATYGNLKRTEAGSRWW